MSNKKKVIIIFVTVAAILFQFVCGGLIVYLVKYIEENAGLNDPASNDQAGTDTSLPTEYSSLKYQISQLDIDTEANKAKASVEIVSNCKFVLRFVDEDSFFSEDRETNKKYIENCFAENEVFITDQADGTLSDAESMELESVITGELPRYFVADAVLVDDQGNEISGHTYNIRNTSRYEEFQSMNAEDYTGTGHIVTFEKNSSENFGVLSDDVKIITAEYVSNGPIELPDGSEVYEIVSPSEELLKGDKVYVTDGVNSALFKVFWTQTNGTTVHACPDNPRYDAGYDLKDFYKFIKADLDYSELVDTESSAGLMQLNSTTGVSKGKIGYYPFKVEFSDDGSGGNTENKVEVEGKIHEGDYKVTVSNVYAPEIFGDEYFECDVKSVVDFKFSVSITAKTASAKAEAYKNSKDVTSIGKIKLPTPIPGFRVTIGFSTHFSYEVASTIKITSAPIYATTGFRYSSEEGLKSQGRSLSIDLNDENPDWFECEGEATLNFGPQIAVGLEFLGLLNVEIEAFVGFRIDATTDGLSLEKQSPYENTLKHECNLCIDGAFSCHFTIGVSAGIKLFKLKWTPLNITLLDVYVKDIVTFYLSMSDKGSGITFGIGECQNYTIGSLVDMSAGCPITDQLICNRNEVNDGLFTRQEEGDTSMYGAAKDYGEHEHFVDSMFVEITDIDTGETLYTGTFVFTRDSYGNSNISSTATDFKYSLSKNRNIRVRATCKCTVYECKVEEGMIGGYFLGYNEDTVTDIYYPSYETEHVLEYEYHQNYVVEKWDDTRLYINGSAYNGKEMEYDYILNVFGPESVSHDYSVG